MFNVLFGMFDRNSVQAILACLTETWCKPCLTYFLATECGKLGDSDYTVEQCHFRGSRSALKWKASMTDRKHTIDTSSLWYLYLVALVQRTVFSCTSLYRCSSTAQTDVLSAVTLLAGGVG